MNLLSSASRVEAPYIKVQIGNYSFGYIEKKGTVIDSNNNKIYNLIGVKYPNYIKSLNVVKINGQVNQYTLKIDYMITEDDDPNYFEKIFSSISKSRDMTFSYGDMAMPNFMFREEKAMFIDASPNFDIQNSKITYIIHAVSKSELSKVGSYTFPAILCKPSDRIKELMYAENEKYGLLDVFSAMRDKKAVERLKLIPDDDIAVQLEMKTNVSVLDYLSYCVSMMTNNKQDSLNKDVYIMSFFDGSYIDGTTEELNGTYFKIVCVSSKLTYKDAYTLDIGYMSSGNPILSFNVEENNTYSVYYDYQNQLNDAGYVLRLTNRGEYKEVYAPILSSGNNLYYTPEEDKTWWAKVTQFPIKASVTIKGLIRQPILMSYLRLNILFFGRKYIYSGYYIITKQQDSISESGFTTTLNMVRVAGDEDTSTLY